MRTCHICGNEVEDRAFCDSCTASVPVWKSPSLMTLEERVEELYMWYPPSILEVPFDVMRERIDLLVGRSTYTHELVDYDSLVSEILRQTPATIEQIREKAVKLVGNDRLIDFDVDGSIDEIAKRN